MIETTVAVRTRSARSAVWLEVSFNGRRPPEDLYADLTMIGWNPSAFPPPPREAIDWSTPDPTTGQRFTVRDWVVEADVVAGPPGAGPRGRWTPADEAAHLRPLLGVLHRHGLRPADPDGLLRAVAGSAPPLPVAPPPPAAPPPPEAAPAPLSAWWRTELVLPPARLSPVLRALEEHGAVWRGAQRQERVAERYRGAEYERELPVVRLEVWVPDATARAAALALADAAGVDAQDRSRVWLEPVGDGGAVGIDAVRPDYRWAG